MDPNFDAIGKDFTRAYYQFFDQKATRPNTAVMYSETDSLLTFEGNQFMGRESIQKKYSELAMQNISRVITTVDCQPTQDGGVIVFVLGQLVLSESKGEKPMGFTQMFVLAKCGESYVIKHNIFRLTLHDIAVS